MAIPTNIKTLLSGDVVEWARIEFKETWDPATSLKTVCAFANDLDNWGGEVRIEADRIEIVSFHVPAKGLEFDMVFLPFCSMKYLPSEERVLANESRDEALKEETKLLYVAITRAKRGLILSYTEEKTELLLEVDTSLYDERELK